MKRFFLLVIFIVAIFHSCPAQSGSTPTVIYDKDFKWTIEIPQGFESVSAEQWAKLQNRGAEAIEKTYDAKVENNAKTIFVFQSDQFNYFESNYQPFDTTEGNYLDNFKKVNDLLYGTFEAQLPKAKLDSVSSSEIIDGKLFQTFEVTITIADNFALKWIMYSRLFGKKEFTVNIMTANKEKRETLLKAWRNSKFVD